MDIEFYTNCLPNTYWSELDLTVMVVDMTLHECLNNDSIITANVGKTFNAVLYNRDLDTDEWNTLCLPFDAFHFNFIIVRS